MYLNTNFTINYMEMKLIKYQIKNLIKNQKKSKKSKKSKKRMEETGYS